MTKLTKADLVATIEALRAEIVTLREIKANYEARLEVAERPTAAPTKAAPAKAAYVPKPDPLAAYRVEYRARVARARARAVETGKCIAIPSFHAWYESLNAAPAQA